MMMTHLLPLPISLMSLPALYLSRVLPEPVMAVIKERFRLTAVPGRGSPERSVLLEGLREADAIICTLTDIIDGEMLDAAPRLRVIANYAVGFNNIAVDQAQARGIVVTNTPDVLTEATADLTWALLLATARRLVEGHRLVKSGAWTGWEPGQLLGAEVHGKTLGILGMGRIGRAVARRASGFTMTVQYYTRSPLPSSSSEPWQPVTFDALLTESDFISLHLPLTTQTTHFIGEAELLRMKSGAILINTARGPLVDEAALVEALRSGSLAGVGLDVYEREPELHPGLGTLSQVLTLPHLGSATLSARTRMGLLCVENVLAVLEGKPAPNPVF